MKLLAASSLGLAVLVSATAGSPAMTFDERWKSLFGVSDVITEAVSAKAEFVRSKDVKKTKAMTRPTRHARRHVARRGNVVRYRQWYKGGKKWHYVYKRRRA